MKMERKRITGNMIKEARTRKKSKKMRNNIKNAIKRKKNKI